MHVCPLMCDASGKMSRRDGGEGRTEAHTGYGLPDDQDGGSFPRRRHR